MTGKQLCAIITGPSLQQVQQQLLLASLYTSLVELRLDLLEIIDIPAIKSIISDSPHQFIFTLRSLSQGGQYTGTLEERRTTLNALAGLNPTYIDLEHTVDCATCASIALNHPKIKIILSYHNFTTFPSNIEALYNQMSIYPAHYYKIALTAQNTNDTLKLLGWAKKHEQVIPIAMGPDGILSRILSNTITYAPLESNASTAPGQLTIDRLALLYRFMHLSKTPLVYGLIGDPIDQSIGHLVHNAVFKALKLDAVYVKMVVKKNELAEFIQLAKELPFQGLSVTMPLKEAVLPYLDQMDDEAAEIGAVNTLLFENETLRGYNTDGAGALDALEKHSKVRGKIILILGAGGAARAIAHEASKRGAALLIATRDKTKAAALAANYPNSQAIDFNEIAKSNYEILINTTPSPMPIDSELLRAGISYMDINTRPSPYSLASRSFKSGCKLIYGYDMFINQAIRQYKIWLPDLK